MFVPGPEDPGPGSILPRSVCFTFSDFGTLRCSVDTSIAVYFRPPLADNITEEFRQLVPFSVFTTNPCR